MRLPVGFVKHSRRRLGRAVGMALVLLAGGGAAGAVALLPTYPYEIGFERGEPTASDHAGALASARAAARRFGASTSVAEDSKPHRPGPEYYRQITSRHVPSALGSAFVPLYREAARTFGVSWRLIASIHRQETAFSTAPSTYRGLNDFGCCAGPMQFNVTNGPPSTWKLYRESFRLGERPRRYPHRTRRHPSVYDDFDAIMAAAALLLDAGATDTLDEASWSAAYAYYGHDPFGIGYASQVLGRALGWELDGFCLNCPVNETLVDAFDDAFGAEARRELRAADRDKKKQQRKKKRAKRNTTTGDEPAKRTPPRRSPGGDDARTTTAPPQPPAETAPPAEPVVPAAPQAPAPPPPPAERKCTPLARLLGCHD
jgi:hypothetical protein